MTSFAERQRNFAHFGALPPGNWKAIRSGRFRQSSLSGPTALLSNFLCEAGSSVELTTKIEIFANNQSPVGFVGLVFGYESDSSFFLLDWKRFDASQGGHSSLGGETAKYGLSIKRVTGG